MWVVLPLPQTLRPRSRLRKQLQPHLKNNCHGNVLMINVPSNLKYSGILWWQMKRIWHRVVDCIQKTSGKRRISAAADRGRDASEPHSSLSPTGGRSALIWKWAGKILLFFYKADGCVIWKELGCYPAGRTEQSLPGSSRARGQGSEGRAGTQQR